MSITNGYATLVEIKSTDVLNFSNTDHDTILETVIEGVSRAIDNHCGRRFYSANETRYYTAKDPYCLRVSDIGSSSGLTIYTDEDGDGTYEYTWASTDYQLYPYNAVTDGWPFTKIETTFQGNYRFPKTRRGVKITSTAFGWPAVPKPINRACVLWSEIVFKRYTTPLGQAAATPVGNIVLKIPGPDPVVMGLLAPYKRVTA